MSRAHLSDLLVTIPTVKREKLQNTSHCIKVLVILGVMLVVIQLQFTEYIP